MSDPKKLSEEEKEDFTTTPIVDELNLVVNTADLECVKNAVKRLQEFLDKYPFNANLKHYSKRVFVDGDVPIQIWRVEIISDIMQELIDGAGEEEEERITSLKTVPNNEVDEWLAKGYEIYGKPRKDTTNVVKIKRAEE